MQVDAPIESALGDRREATYGRGPSGPGSQRMSPAATAARTTDFAIQPTQLGQLGTINLIADPVGSSKAIASPKVVVKPGTRLVWTLQTDLSRSSLAVY